MYLWVLNMIRKRLFSSEGKIKPMYFLSEVLSQKFTQKTNISMPILFVIQTDLESFRTIWKISHQSMLYHLILKATEYTPFNRL